MCENERELLKEGDAQFPAWHTYSASRKVSFGFFLFQDGMIARGKWEKYMIIYFLLCIDNEINYKFD